MHKCVEVTFDQVCVWQIDSLTLDTADGDIEHQVTVRKWMRMNSFEWLWMPTGDWASNISGYTSCNNSSSPLT